MTGTDFKKGDYVVLLSSCDGKDCWADSMPQNWCYQLRAQSKINQFDVQKDSNGHSNGWSHHDVSSVNKLLLRAATPAEIQTYKALGKPFYIKPVTNHYSIY